MVRGEESTGNDSPPVKGAIWVKPHESAGHHVRGYWRGPNGEQIKTGEQAASSASLMPLRKTLGGKTGSKPDLDKINEFSAASEAYTAEHAAELDDRLMDQLDRESNGEIIPKDEVVIIAPYQFDLSRSILIAGNDPVSMRYYDALKGTSTDEELSMAIKHGSRPHDGIIDRSGTASASIAFRSMVQNGRVDKISRENALKLTRLTGTMRTDYRSDEHDADIIALRPDLFRDDDLKTIMSNPHDDYTMSYAYSAYREYSKRHANDDVIEKNIADGSIPPGLVYKAEHIPRLIHDEKAGEVDPKKLNAILNRTNRLGLNLNDLNSASSMIDDHISFIKQVRDEPRYGESTRLMANDAIKIIDRKTLDANAILIDANPTEKWSQEEQISGMRSSLILTYGSGKHPDDRIMSSLFDSGAFKSNPSEEYEDDGWGEGAYVDQGPIASDSDYKALALGCKRGWLDSHRIVELARDEVFTNFFMKSSCWKNMDAATRKEVRAISRDQNQYSKY